MAAVSAVLTINVTKAIEELIGTPKKPGSHRAEMIGSCGELDKEEARGWLVADAVGRPLLHRNDDRSQNDARDVGKRVLERSGKAEKAIASAKETAQSKVRSAKRAATKDASLLSLVADAEAAVATEVAAAKNAPVDLDFPAATSGPERPASYWRRREVLEADASAVAAADAAAVAKAAARRTHTLAQRAGQAAQEPVARADADERYFKAARVAAEAAIASRKAAAAAELGKAQAGLVRRVAINEGVDARPGSDAKRRREDARMASVAADADVAGVVEDMIAAIEAPVEPAFWMTRDDWYDIAGKGRWTRELYTSTDRKYQISRPRAAEEAAVGVRQEMLRDFEAVAREIETRFRARAWAAEAKEEPAVLALARRLEAGDVGDDDPGPDPADYPPEPDDAEWDAAVAAWESRRAAQEEVNARAEEVVRQRILETWPHEVV